MLIRKPVEIFQETIQREIDGAFHVACQKLGLCPDINDYASLFLELLQIGFRAFPIVNLNRLHHALRDDHCL